MKIGFIGSGNMAGAIINGVIKAKVISAQDISVFDIDEAKMEACAKTHGVHPTESIDSLIAESDTVILAVKPVVFPTLIPSLNDKLQKQNPLLISIAAGKTLDDIQSLLRYRPRLVRIMPNINAKVCASMSAYCCNEKVSDEDRSAVTSIFSAIGKVIALDESYFPLFTVIAGSSPAFVYMMIDSIARAAVKNGMNKQAALHIAAQTVMGSAKMVLRAPEHPWELVDQVCSPGGTTIEGVCSLQDSGFEAAIQKAIDAAIQKDKLL